MRRWASGVSLVTSNAGGRIHGMTVTSFAALSLDPPLVLASLRRTTRTHQMVSESGLFAVALLAQDQEQLSIRFAGLTADEGDRFQGLSYSSTPNGCPVPAGCLAYLDCEVSATHDAGTHTVFIGEVQSGEVLRQAAPLIYHNRDYRLLEEPDDRPALE